MEQQRIPTLDGWRGVAILLVLQDHFQPDSIPFPHLGIHGVTIFFVLSGFLITSKLVQEQRQTGRIDLRAFYKRRAWRLMPAAWCFLLVVFAVRAILHMASWTELLSCLFFWRNYYPVHGPSATTGHFWSLAIEEQFYLVWPCILALVSWRNARWFAALGVAAGLIYRLVFHAQLVGESIIPRLHTPVHAPALLIGCLMALALQSGRIRRAVDQLPETLVLLGLIACIALAGKLVPLTECALLALLLARGASHTSWLTRTLSSRPLRMLGWWSYSIYLWQQLPMLFLSNELAKLPLKLLLVAALSLGSYYLIERPSMRAGRRLTPEIPRVPPIEAAPLTIP